MGGWIMLIGGLGVLFGAFDVLDLGDTKKIDWKKPVIKIIGGLAVVGVGALMKHFGV